MKKESKYKGSWTMNCGQTGRDGYEGNNLRQLASHLIKVVKGNLSPNESGNVHIFDEDSEYSQYHCTVKRHKSGKYTISA